MKTHHIGHVDFFLLEAEEVLEVSRLRGLEHFAGRRARVGGVQVGKYGAVGKYGETELNIGASSGVAEEILEFLGLRVVCGCLVEPIEGFGVGTMLEEEFDCCLVAAAGGNVEGGALVVVVRVGVSAGFEEGFDLAAVAVAGGIQEMGLVFLAVEHGAVFGFDFGDDVGATVAGGFLERRVAPVVAHVDVDAVVVDKHLDEVDVSFIGSNVQRCAAIHITMFWVDACFDELFATVDVTDGGFVAQLGGTHGFVRLVIFSGKVVRLLAMVRDVKADFFKLRTDVERFDPATLAAKSNDFHSGAGHHCGPDTNNEHGQELPPEELAIAAIQDAPLRVIAAVFAPVTREFRSSARLGPTGSKDANKDGSHGTREGLERGHVQNIVEFDERLDELAPEPGAQCKYTCPTTF